MSCHDSVLQLTATSHVPSLNESESLYAGSPRTQSQLHPLLLLQPTSLQAWSSSGLWEWPHLGTHHPRQYTMRIWKAQDVTCLLNTSLCLKTWKIIHASERWYKWVHVATTISHSKFVHPSQKAKWSTSWLKQAKWLLDAPILCSVSVSIEARVITNLYIVCANCSSMSPYN